jgi:hypothetical protein
MPEELVAAEGVAPLSQGARFVDTFVAPSKTFMDIRRSASWWVPFVFMILTGIVFTTAVDKKVGFDQIAQQQIEKNKFAADQINALPADQRAVQYHKAAQRTKVISYCFPVLILIFAAIISLLWWGTVNFAFGAKTKYSQIFAIWMYAALPKALMSLVVTIVLFAGVSTDNFDMQNPLGTNPGYYMADAGAGLKAALSFIDLFGLWSIVLAIIGISIVARKSKGQAAIVVLSWWVLGLLLSAGAAALTS